jgi:hypothetical protein
MSNEVYKNAMTQHFKNRMSKRVGVNVTREQRKNIIDSIQGHGPYKSSFSGRTGDAHRSWFFVAFEGVGVYVLYDNKYNKLVTCLDYQDKPIESLRNDLLQADKQLALKLYEVDKLKAHIVDLQAEIKERENEKK